MLEALHFVIAPLPETLPGGVRVLYQVIYLL